VLDVDEPVLLADAGRPPFDRGGIELDGSPTRPAEQVVVMAAAAAPVDVLALSGPDDVNIAVLGEALQGAVHGGEPDPVALGTQSGVQLLGAEELAGALQC
jgi:hypothetical protein